MDDIFLTCYWLLKTFCVSKPASHRSINKTVSPILISLINLPTLSISLNLSVVEGEKHCLFVKLHKINNMKLYQGTWWPTHK